IAPLREMFGKSIIAKGAFKVDFGLTIKISNKGVKVGKRVTPIAKSVKQKTKYDLKDYCQMRGLSLSSLYKGYISKKAAKILKKDGIKVA
ncbi:hypothetical protein CFVB10_10055, partial [Campylobacter fetus subsp. venerealis cfvB10]